MKTRTRGLRVLSLVLLLIAVALVACSRGMDSQEGGSAEMEASRDVREPAVAGAFYPGTEQALRDDVSKLLDAVEPQSLGGRLVGLISPHAGYVYSGGVAAHAYRLVKGVDYDAVIVIAPSHHVYFPGSSVYMQGSYRTPLGLIEIDSELAGAIAGSDETIGFHPDAHSREHSLEVQLPFLQMTIPDFKLVPIVMGDQSLENCKRLAAAIVSNTKGKNVLLVASTDLSHFHGYDEAVRMDRIVIDHVERYDYVGLAASLAARKCEACGGGPTITVMIAAQELGATRAVPLKYANSGDVTDDKSRVVGYLAAALVEDAGKADRLDEDEDAADTEQSAVGVDLGLKRGEKKELLDIARRSLEAKVLGRPIPEFTTDSDLLKAKMGAFVTLTKHGQLRGCIGHIKGIEPLYITVSKMAIAAGTEDPRFSPVEPGEIADLAVEISVLTPFRKIRDPEEIQVGRDGIYIEKGYNHGLLLPQVATEYGWDREEFLQHTCRKAGLPLDAWKEGADIFIFSGQVFNEGDLAGEPSSRE